MDKKVDKIRTTQEFFQFKSRRALALVEFRYWATTNERKTLVKLLKTGVETGSEKSMDCHLLDMKKLAEGARDKMLQLRAGRVYGLCVAPSRAAPLTRLTPLRN
jgi:hypothetical protein